MKKTEMMKRFEEETDKQSAILKFMSGGQALEQKSYPKLGPYAYNTEYLAWLETKAAAYDRIMSGSQKTPKEIANIFGFPIAMNCYSSNHEFQSGSDWNWFTTKPFIDGENDCWTMKRGMWGRVPYGLLNGYVGDWQDSLTLPDGWETKGENK